MMDMNEQLIRLLQSRITIKQNLIASLWKEAYEFQECGEPTWMVLRHKDLVISLEFDQKVDKKLLAALYQARQIEEEFRELANSNYWDDDV